jgi:uncharacterized circularly permuted ATP-grasp superfamily protein/uncharacterized alpha-E superfamily protein
LLDALLQDVYGPQRVLLEGLLPPELIFGNPHLLRACHGMSVPRERWLPLYCADLVRLPDGSFAVLEDRTQAPSGAGYALENRIVISSVLPEAFRECGIERLSLFFRALRDTLQWLAPHNRDNPRIVLLTSGPYNATYFEQAYLAQYLSYTLVNGGDLTVRNDHVYLKTLSGLQPVDVILRRINDDYSDPLELRPESVLGTPGLVQAARQGNVAIANPLGTGLLQTPALLPFIAGLCKALLGEELLLPSVRSYWCGERWALREGIASFRDVVVRRSFPQGFVQPVLTAQLTSDARAELLRAIEARPEQYVIQERVHASTTPTFTEHTLSPRALVMRCFAVAGRDDYVVMPGALSRTADAGEGTEASMQLGAGSKDTWVLSRGSVTNFSLLPPIDRPVPLSRGGSALPSRATDNLYWLGRYAERAEGVARLARVVCSRLNDLVNQNDLEHSQEFVALLRALSTQTSLNYTGGLTVGDSVDLASAQAQLIAAVTDETRTGTLRACVSSALRAGRLVRDRISTDTWRVLAALDDELRIDGAALEREPMGTLLDVLNRVVLRLAAFSGLAIDSMTRGHAWRFLDMGRRLERAMTLLMLLRSTLTQRCERGTPLLEAVLEVADSSMTYRRRYLARLQLPPVVDLLLTDETNPRSVIYQLDALTRHLEALPPAPDGLRSPQERIALGVLTELKLCDIEWLCTPRPAGERPRLSQYLLELGARIPALSDSLSDRYLSHATVSRHLGFDDRAPSSLLAASRGDEP